MPDTQLKPKITENDNGTFDGACPLDRCGYVYDRAPTRKAARERLDEHMTEHSKADATTG